MFWLISVFLLRRFLEKLREDTDDENYLESIENADSEVEDLANFIA
jgi:hypothetical protein